MLAALALLCCGRKPEPTPAPPSQAVVQAQVVPLAPVRSGNLPPLAARHCSSLPELLTLLLTPVSSWSASPPAAVLACVADYLCFLCFTYEGRLGWLEDEPRPRAVIDDVNSAIGAKVGLAAGMLAVFSGYTGALFFPDMVTDAERAASRRGSRPLVVERVHGSSTRTANEALCRLVRCRAAVVAQRYALVSVAGAGGCGIVFRALSLPSGDRQRAVVAVKLERQGATRTPAIRREYEALVRLGHVAGVPRVAEYVRYTVAQGGADEQRYDGLVTELLGVSVSRLAHAFGGRLSELDVAVVGLQALRRLASVHAAGICHRDVKPSNLMIGRAADRHVVYLIDFGSASLGDCSEEQDRDRNWQGTPAYSSANALLGNNPLHADDLESLLLTLMRLLGGLDPPWRREWDGDCGFVMAAVVRPGLVAQHVAELTVAFPASTWLPALASAATAGFSASRDCLAYTFAETLLALVRRGGVKGPCWVPFSVRELRNAQNLSAAMVETRDPRAALRLEALGLIVNAELREPLDRDSRRTLRSVLQELPEGETEFAQPDRCEASARGGGDVPVSDLVHSEEHSS